MPCTDTTADWYLRIHNMPKNKNMFPDFLLQVTSDLGHSCKHCASKLVAFFVFHAVCMPVENKRTNTHVHVFIYTLNKSVDVISKKKNWGPLGGYPTVVPKILPQIPLYNQYITHI